MNEINEDEAKRVVLARLMEQLGLTPEIVELDAQAAREQYESDQARDTYAYFGLAIIRPRSSSTKW